MSNRSHEEETINAYTHLAWCIGSLFTLIFFVTVLDISNKGKISSLFMMGFSSWTFFSSFLYHISRGVSKKKNREIDKTSIYLMIMGCGVSINMSYTDSVVALSSCALLILFSVGLLAKYCKNPEGSESFSLICYVLLGWSCVLPLTEVLSPSLYGITSSSKYIILGGIFYSIGILYYSRDSIKWNHTKWHVCVMIGYLLHIIGHYKAISYSQSVF